MPRKARYILKEYLHQIPQRGTNKELTFTEKRDLAEYLDINERLRPLCYLR